MSTLRKRLRVTSVVAGIGIVAVLVAGCARGGDTGGSGDATEGPAEASPGITDTSITFGITSPLTGATAGPGNCTVDGALAYFGVKNAEGGIEFGDGKTRTVEIKAYDDAYDPQKALANFQQMVSDGVFAAGVGLGTPTNRAWREAAIDEGVPQVLVMTGDPIFSDRAESPEQLGLVPIYQQEGGAFGELLASSGEDHKVAILSQNDDYGNGYVEGFTEAIEGADNIEVVKALTYEATDTDVNAQLTELAASGADVFFNAMSITPLVIASLKKTEELGWTPSWFLPSNTSSPGGILQQPDVHADVFPGIYTVAFSQSAASPTFAESEEGAAFLEAIGEYTATRRACPPSRTACGADRRCNSRAGLREDGRADPRELHGGAHEHRGLQRPVHARGLDDQHDGRRQARRVGRAGAEVQRQGLRPRRDVRRLI